MLKHYIAPNALCDKIKSAKSLSKSSEIIPANVFENIDQIQNLRKIVDWFANFIILQNQELLIEIENLKKGLNIDVVAQALREVKEYAARSSEINVDTMQLKLMHLDEVARRVNDSNRELYSMVLQRFLCHKNHDKIGFLVTSLLSSPAETKIFEKEQKFLKVHGSDKEKVSDESQQNASNQ